MIKSLKALFAQPVAQDAAEIEHQLQLAAAALLVEMSRADYVVGDEEHQAMQLALQTALGVSSSEVEQLISLAGTTADRATSLYEFTRQINDHYSKQQKLVLILSMWRVAYADQDLNKYEERLIRQVSDLIHVSHSDFIKMKRQVADSASPAQELP
jgi:uncharacterized tellurite resistance protein B-like protein